MNSKRVQNKENIPVFGSQGIVNGAYLFEVWDCIWIIYIFRWAWSWSTWSMGFALLERYSLQISIGINTIDCVNGHECFTCLPL